MTTEELTKADFGNVRRWIEERIHSAQRTLALFDALPDDLWCDICDQGGILYVYCKPDEIETWRDRLAALGLTDQLAREGGWSCAGELGIVRLFPAKMGLYEEEGEGNGL